jgi:hypothetical protein
MVPCKIILKELSSVSYCEKSGYLRCIKDIKNIIFFNTITLSGVGVDWTVRANIGRVWRVGSFQIYQAKKGALVSKYTLHFHSKFFQEEHVYFTNQYKKMTLVSSYMIELAG